jgi:hypothetical protein
VDVSKGFEVLGPNRDLGKEVALTRKGETFAGAKFPRTAEERFREWRPADLEAGGRFEYAEGFPKDSREPIHGGVDTVA